MAAWNASFGVGFVLGPLMGGLLGAYSPRAPFALAALLNLVSACVCFFVLPEPDRAPTQPGARAASLNPFASLLLLREFRGLGPLVYIFATMAMVGQVPSVLWVLYGTARFGWSSFAVGMSFAVFGLLHALGQVFLPDPAQRHLGERGTIAAGMAVDAVGYAAFSLARTSRAAFSIMPAMALAGVGEPAMQSMLTGRVAADRQGELQGVLTSLVSLTSIAGPVAFSALYSALQLHVPAYPGAVWLTSIALYVPCFALLLRSRPPRGTA